MSTYNSPKFHKLRSKWYKILKKSGFTDIEQDVSIYKKDYTPYGCEIDLRSIGSYENYLIKQEYYIQAEHFLNSHKFKSIVHKLIWKHHSEGLSVRKIAALLKKQAADHNMTLNKDVVQKVVLQLKEKMLQDMQRNDNLQE